MITKLIAYLVSHWLPDLVGYLLARVHPDDIGKKIQPILVDVMKDMDPKWRDNIALALHKLADAIQASIPPRG